MSTQCRLCYIIKSLSRLSLGMMVVLSMCGISKMGNSCQNSEMHMG